MKTVFMVLLAIVSVVLILVVMLQQGNSNGLSAVSGGSDTLFGTRKKAKGYEEKLAKLTAILAAAFIVVTLAIVIIE